MLYHVCSVDAATPAEHSVAARRCTQYAAPNARAPLASSNRHMQEQRVLSHLSVCALPPYVRPQVAYARSSAHALKVFWSSLETTFRCCISWILSTKTRNCIATPRQRGPGLAPTTKQSAQRARVRERCALAFASVMCHERDQMLRGSAAPSRARRRAQGDTRKATPSPDDDKRDASVQARNTAWNQHAGRHVG